MKTWKSLLILFSLLLLTATGAGTSAAGGGKPSAPKEKAPEFTLKDLSGREVSSRSLAGKVLLVNFWATWCPSCTTEMPSLSKIQKEWKSRGLEVIAISSDRTVDDVKSYVSDKGFAFTILFDATHSATKQYRIFALPTTFLIDRKGNIVDKFFGEYDWATDAEVRQKIERLF